MIACTSLRQREHVSPCTACELPPAGLRSVAQRVRLVRSRPWPRSRLSRVAYQRVVRCASLLHRVRRWRHGISSILMSRSARLASGERPCSRRRRNRRPRAAQCCTCSSAGSASCSSSGSSPRRWPSARTACSTTSGSAGRFLSRCARRRSSSAASRSAAGSCWRRSSRPPILIARTRSRARRRRRDTGRRPASSWTSGRCTRAWAPTARSRCSRRTGRASSRTTISCASSARASTRCASRSPTGWSTCSRASRGLGRRRWRARCSGC